ncbi:ShlB/FhaC/HecB family hemolysin secretion/activation protein [Xenorhabdus anantnagensis]|uniref:ShlB/FhaC/HecB family hemolysin secretion/activation protein n=1 Tax=Xenorhabdus anantnagensis TaxID=3025875 RepID=A0ABT5LUW7_9GAMM|nr:ShlB/FhaC/HecB family hemolysin secretion/activation protein [Xenorhabdus anantnagensis]MDC9598216.1 ShlB/FhaC/HecB family hemolysin secretion/activation protein [Xenorhabdus anantnagensis]
MGWTVFVILPVQADTAPVVPQIQQQRQEPPLEAPSAVLDSQRQQQKALLEAAHQQREDLQKFQSLPIPPAERVPADDTQCVTINNITFQGAGALSESAQRNLAQPYLHHCVTLAGLKQLVRTVSNAYIAEGYITSQAYLPEQDLTEGQLRIAVIESGVEAIEIEGKPPRTAKMLFPDRVGHILNLRDIEQGLEQLNRLSSSRFTIDIQPGTQPGYSIVHIRQQAGFFPGKVRLNLANSGQKGIGEYQASAELTLDTPLGFGEQWLFSWTQDTDFRPEHHNRNLALSVSIPYGYWTARYHYFRNTALQSLQIMAKNYPYASENLIHQMDIGRTLYRDGRQKLGLQFSVRHKTVKKALGGYTLTTSSPVIRTANIHPQYSTRLGGGYLTFSPTFEYGNVVISPPLAARNTFRKFNLSSSYYYPITANTAYLTSFYGQLSPDNLLFSEQLSLGGLYSVRGFKTQSLSGNQGFFLRQEIIHALNPVQVDALTLTGALDYGYLFGQPRYGVEEARLLGAAFGVTLKKRALSARLMLGKPLHFPHTLKPDAWSLYAAASLEF